MIEVCHHTVKHTNYIPQNQLQGIPNRTNKDDENFGRKLQIQNFGNKQFNKIQKLVKLATSIPKKEKRKIC